MSRFSIIFTISLQCLGIHAQQINNLNILSPTSIAGNYEVMRAEFGSRDSTSISAGAVFVDDGTTSPTLGCQDPINNITGKIAFIDRGFCEFSDKALRAQKKGAIAVIICGDLSNIAQVLFPMASGSFGNQVIIPTFMLLQKDCYKLRADLTSGLVNATLESNCLNNAVYPISTIWGNKQGEGDFNKGLNGWTIDKIHTWSFLPEGNIIGNAFGDQRMNSWTKCNGAVGFLSDKLDNNGNASNQGGGLCPAPCTGALISPTIDLTAFNIDGITIEFAQTTRQFQSLYWLLTSKDGGISWDSIKLNTALPVNSLVTHNRQKVALVGYEGAKSLIIKFEYVGNYYYWAIDDVIVLNDKFEDVMIDKTSIAGAPSLKVPNSQVAPMVMFTSIANIGNSNAYNPNLTFSVKNVQSPNINVFSINNIISSLSANSDKDVIFTQTFTTPSIKGDYEGLYEITSISDNNPSNNKATFNFSVTDNFFSNTPPEIIGDPFTSLSVLTTHGTVIESPYFYTAANVYYVSKGKELTIDSLVFGFANNIEQIEKSGFIEAVIYQWSDDDNNDKASPEERLKVGGNKIWIENKYPNARRIAIPVWASLPDGKYDDGKQFELKDNTNYICAIRAIPIDVTVPRYQFLAYSGNLNNHYDTQMSYINQRQAQNKLPNFADKYAGSFFGLTSTSEEGLDFETYESYDSLINAQTVFIDAYLGRYETRIVDSDPDDAKISTAQNPVYQEITVDAALPQKTILNVTLISKEGQLLYKNSYHDFKKDRIVISVENLPSGVYTLKLQADNTIITKEVVVVK